MNKYLKHFKEALHRLIPVALLLGIFIILLTALLLFVVLCTKVLAILI